MEAAAAHESPPTRPTPREYLQTIVLAAAIGIPAALVAALFLAAVHYFEHWLWIDLPDALGESTPPWYLVIGLPFAECLSASGLRTLSLASRAGRSLKSGLARYKI